MRARGWSARRLRWEDVLKKLFARFHLLHDVLRADRRALPVLRVPQQTGAAAHRVAQPEHVKDERPESVGLRAESVGLHAVCMRLQPGCVGLQPATHGVAAQRPSAPAHERDEGRVALIAESRRVALVFTTCNELVDGMQLRPPD